MNVKAYEIITNSTGVIQSYDDVTQEIYEGLNFDYEINDNQYIKGNDITLKVFEDFFPGTFSTVENLMTYITTAANRANYFLAIEIDSTIKFCFRFRSVEYDYKTELFTAEFESIESVFIDYAKAYYVGSANTSTDLGYAVRDAICDMNVLYYDTFTLNSRWGFNLGEIIRNFAGKKIQRIHVDSVISEVLHTFTDEKEDDYHCLIFRGDSDSSGSTSIDDAIDNTFNDDGINDFSMTLFDVIKLAFRAWNGIISLNPSFTLAVSNNFEFDLNFYTRTNSPDKTPLSLDTTQQKLKAYNNKIDTLIITGENFSKSFIHNVFIKYGKDIELSVDINNPDNPIVSDSIELIWARATYQGTYTYPLYTLDYGSTGNNTGWASSDGEINKWYGQLISTTWYLATNGDGHVLEGECVYSSTLDFFEEISVSGDVYIISKISFIPDGLVKYKALKK